MALIPLLFGIQRNEVDSDIIQNLVDSMVNRALIKGVLELDKRKTISDYYLIEVNDE